MSLAANLLKKIQTEGTCTYGQLVEYTMQEGYKVETMGRRLREHAEDQLIYPIMRRSKRNTEYISAYTATPLKTPKKPQEPVIKIINGVPTAVYGA